jgi:hypothetical protein
MRTQQLALHNLAASEGFISRAIHPPALRMMVTTHTQPTRSSQQNPG